MVGSGVGDTILFYQEKTTTTTTYDRSGNVIDKFSFKTKTWASYSLDGPGGTPRFLSGTGGQDAAEKALGGASHVYDTLVSGIRTRGWIAFGSKAAAGFPAGAEAGAGVMMLDVAKIAVTAVREAIIDHLINRYYKQGD